MKPFNLEQAKAGKPVCTRNGRNVRILCFDLKDELYKVIAAITLEDGTECVASYTEEGRHYNKTESIDDLMMAPEKKQGFIAIYRSLIYNVMAETSNIYASIEELEKHIKQAGIIEDNIIEIRPIEWEE